MSTADQRAADSNTLIREPTRCPHCGEALPREPELLGRGRAPEEPVQTHPETIEARYRPTLRRVEVFGGESGFSEADPLTVRAEQVDSARDALRWMGEVGSKPWVRGEPFLLQLADALVMALNDRGERDNGAGKPGP